MVIVDHFCGGGGESTGLMQAAEEFEMDVELHAHNHWEKAIETHKHNHPDAIHRQAAIENLNPVECVRGQRVGLMWASPECTHHSIARGGRPCEDQSRATAMHVIKWAQELYIDRIIVENVPEFLTWGPLGVDGRPIKSRAGDTFRAWCGMLKSLGYRVDWRVLRACDYGDPTTRKRLFVQAVRGKNRILWPEPTHSETPDVFGSKPWVPARQIIDWSIESPSIFGRKKPLADATLSRIEAGIKKYWGEMAEPFIYASGHRSSIRVSPISKPLSTVVTKQEHCLVEPFIVQYYGNGEARDINRPLDTVTCRDRFGVVGAVGLDIRFRMLQPHELAAAQGFPKGYYFAGSKADQIKQIGNAVCPGVARAMARKIFEEEGK